MIAFLWQRLWRAYTTWPTVAGWFEAAAIFVTFLVIATPLAIATQIAELKLTTASLDQILTVAAIAFFVPSLLEETLYRALLLPHPQEETSWPAMLGQMALSVALFVAGHPLAAWLFRLGPEAEKLFYNPAFLVLAAIFGVACSVVYLRSGSIWPCVLMHWSLVVAWMIWFGGFISAARAS